MAKRHKKEPQIVTFKADQTLLDAMRGVENRSEFIRTALLAALDNACPLCKGRGILTPRQKDHWKSFTANHELAECQECHEFHLICHGQSKRSERRVH